MNYIEGAIFNQEAEQAFIGCLLIEGELIKETVIQSKNIYTSQLRMIFNAIAKVDQKARPVDLVSIVEELGENVLNVGGVDFLSDLASSVPTTANFKHYEAIILNKWKIRRAVELSDRAKEVVLSDDSTEVISKLIHEFEELESAGDTEKEFNLKELLVEIYEEDQLPKGEITGIPTGYKEFDRITSGWQESDLVIIGARPSVGKTAFALNFASNAAKNNYPVGLFSLEMSDKQLIKRMISAEGNVLGTKLRNPEKDFSDQDWNKYINSLSVIGKMPLQIWDRPGVGMSYIRKETRKFRRKHKNKKVLIMIDYLQLILGSTKHGGNRQQEIGEISRELKTMARELNVTVVALSQLSRAVESRQDKRPMLSDLRESGQIEQDADLIGFLYRDDYYNKDTEAKNVIEIILAKHRNGPTGVVELAFLKEYNKFVNLDRRL